MTPLAPSMTIDQLREWMGSVTIGRGSDADAQRVVPLACGGELRLGALHEWFGVAEGAGREWTPPLCVLSDIARRSLDVRGVGQIVWIGRDVWPHARFIDACPGVLAASVFIDPPDNASRLWTIDTALRCASPMLVIADGCGLTLAHTRRLQLAAGSAAGDGATDGQGLCVLARPPWEASGLSAATTRWRVDRARSPTGRPRWTIALVRNKDHPALTEDAPVKTLEWNDAQGLICLPSAVADRADHPTACAS